MSLTVNGTVELSTWVLGFGKQVEVLSPERFRREIADEMREALRAYE